MPLPVQPPVRESGSFAPTVSAGPDSQPQANVYSRKAMTTYAVKWREPDGATYLGRLALGERALGLEGRRQDGPAVDRQIGYEEILGLRIGSHGVDRLDGQSALVVERADGPYLVTSAGIGAGVVREVADRLADLRRAVLPRAAAVAPGS